MIEANEIVINFTSGPFGRQVHEPVVSESVISVHRVTQLAPLKYRHNCLPVVVK